MSNKFYGLKKNVSFAAILLACLISTGVRAGVKSFQVKPDGVTFKLDKGLMKIVVCKDDIIEVKYTIFDSFQEKPSLVVNNAWAQHPVFKVTGQQNETFFLRP